MNLFNDDCLKVMRTLPDNSVDAIVTDPPYLTTDLRFDRNGLSMEWVNESLRIVKSDGYLAVFCPVEMSAAIARLWSLRFTGFWLKSNSGMRTASAKKPMSKSELYTVFAHPKHQVKNLTWNCVKIEGKPYSKKQRLSGYCRGGKDQLDRASPSGWTKDGYISENDGFRLQTDVILGNPKPCMPHAERTDHPTQKPVNVISTLVQWLTNEGDLILDPFMGSGTTGIACKNLERDFIGIELDAEYFQIAQQRIEAAAPVAQNPIVAQPIQPAAKVEEHQMRLSL